MPVRAKFQVGSITRTKGQRYMGTQQGYVDCEMQTIHLQPVTSSGSEEDKKFWASTPQGKIELGCVNPEAGNQFALGQKFYVDFTPAEE
jgi:hypothetical protein